MAEFPALPLWTDALIGDTYHLSPAEFGAYLRLLIAEWRRPKCDLPDDDDFLGRCVGDTRNWRRLKPVVMAFFTLGDDGMWRQKRLLREREYVSRKSEVQRANSHARWNKNKDLPDAMAIPPDMPTACQTDAPTPTPTPKQEKKKKEVTKGNAPNGALGILPIWLPKPVWDNFTEHRREMKEPLSVRAEEMALSKLTRLHDEGYDAQEVIEQTIINRWKGLFEVTSNKNGNGHKHEKRSAVFEGAAKFLNANGVRGASEAVDETDHDPGIGAARCHVSSDPDVERDGSEIPSLFRGPKLINGG